MFASNTSQVSSDATYIEDVFSTYLYTGNNTYPRQLINGIDLAGKGGLIWSKVRNISGGHFLVDTATAPSGNYFLQSDNTNALTNSTTYSYNNNGYTFQSTNENYGYDQYTFASWTFRKQPKFFDVVTWTGTGKNVNLGQQPNALAHNLGSVPGCVIVKRLDQSENWQVYHQSLGNQGVLLLNTTDSAFYLQPQWGKTTPTATTLYVANANDILGATYVAYLFAHDAGGFGLTGTDNVISCGSFTTGTNRNFSVNLGYEPQWLLVKRTNSAEDWVVIDNMRAWSMTGFNLLYPNSSSSETNNTAPYLVTPTATGFEQTGTSGAFNGSYIYIAIRRGPMKTPTSGTSVFAAQATAASTNGTALQPRYTSNFPLDLIVQGYRAGGGGNTLFMDRLRGSATTGLYYLISSKTDAEGGPGNLLADTMNGVYVNGGAGADSTLNAWMFRRAPGFFDEVCYTGQNFGNGIKHNLGVAPELIFIKRRNSTGNWAAGTAFTASTQKVLYLNSNIPEDWTSYNSAAAFQARPIATEFYVGSSSDFDLSGATYVAYLFASCPGVSKVGSYTGNGSSQTINCGFTGGARFVLIKRTDSTGDWYVWDTARGIVSANDPRLSLNSTAAEVTTDDSIDPDNSGFIVNQVSATNINVSSATYIYLAIA